jgi:two-component system, NarL family, invasion response regulator UvrY
VTGETSTGDEAIQVVRDNYLDSAVLDISMPDKNGVDTLNELIKVSVALAVLINNT